jgi:hypothetical protein
MDGETIMGAVKDLFYDIETLFIEGYSAKAISVQLGIPIREVYDVLDTFGVVEEDMDVADQPQDDNYYGA